MTLRTDFETALTVEIAPNGIGGISAADLQAAILLLSDSILFSDEQPSLAPEDGTVGDLVYTAGIPVVGPGAIDTSKVDATREVSFSDSSTSGAVVIPAQSGAFLSGGFPIYNASGLLVPTSLANTKIALGITGADIVAAINAELGGTTWQGGGGSGPFAPAQFGSGDWSLSDPATNGDLNITITTLPDDGGDSLTDIEYRVDGGSWTSVGAATTGTYGIAGLTNDVEVDVEIRAQNATGDGTASAIKSATPTNPSYSPTFVDNTGTATIVALAAAFSDSIYFTFAITAIPQTAGGGVDYWMEVDTSRSSIQYDATNGKVVVIVKNTANTIIYQAETAWAEGVQHTMVFSASFGTTPVIDWYMDGTALSVTGDVNTGINVVTSPVAGTVDWTRTNVNFFKTPIPDLHVADLYLDPTQKVSPALFFSGSNPVDWVGVGAPAIYYGSNQTAANWSDNTANLGSATSGNLTNLTFTAV